MRKSLLSAALAMLAFLALSAGATSVSAQQTCAEIDLVRLECPDLKTVSGEPPACSCNGVPIDPPLEPTCERNYGCPDNSYVGTGNWPECGCRKVKEGSPPPGGGNGAEGAPGGIGTSLGGSDTCEQFFECPSGSEMEVSGGQCRCTLVMLPAWRD